MTRLFSILLISLLPVTDIYCFFEVFQVQGNVRQSVNDSVRSGELFNKAMGLYKSADYDLAGELATEGLKFARSSGDENTELSLLYLLSSIQKARDRTDEAILYEFQIAVIHEKRKDTTGLIDIFSDLGGSYYRLGIYDKAGENYMKAFNLLSPVHVEERALYLESAGLCALYDGKADSAFRCFTTLRKILNDSGKDDTRAILSLVKASERSGDYFQALALNDELFKKLSIANDLERMSAVINNIAYNYTMRGQYSKALEAYREAMEYGRKAGINDADQALLLANMGICLYNNSESEEALKYFLDAAEKYGKTNQFNEKGRIENIMAQIYFHEGDLYNAGIFSRKAIESSEQSGDAGLYAESCLTYSRILREGNDPIGALEYYERYLALNDSLQLEVKLGEERKSGQRLQLERSEKEISLKAKTEELTILSLKQLRLQLEKEEREKELLLREGEVERLERERLRQEIEIARQQNMAAQQEKVKRQLEWENQLKDAQLMQDSLKQVSQAKEIENLETQKEITRINMEREKATKMLMTWIAVLMILAAISILGGLITTRRKNSLLARQKREIQEQNADLEQKNEEIIAQRDEIESQRDLLMAQKEEIEHINSEITQSIEYAKKIQTSTLPDREELDTLTKENFIFYRPRDIVSGDFYWFASVNGTFIVTVADCTGHGVPGAFMSMLGMSLLKEIVLKEYITQPSVILRRLRKEIIEALGQKGIPGEQKDGMDMSLLSIYPESGRIEYAGAFNPVYIIRNRTLPALSGDAVTVVENEHLCLYNLHADKMPVALYDRMNKFTTYEFLFEEGDRIYLFTDGFADQFGGPDGKKFMYKPFMNLLLANAELPMSEQYQRLADAFKSWKGKLPQVDDVCVIGMKLKR